MIIQKNFVVKEGAFERELFGNFDENIKLIEETLKILVDIYPNRQMVLEKLGDRLERTAYFECVICYMYERELKLFMGRAFGEITEEEIGKTDFGYDCIFHSVDLDKTFGEATQKEKDSVSHRAKAVEGFKKWLTPTNPNFSRFVNFNK